MRTDLRSSILWLGHDQLLELRHARGRGVTTVIGQVWVTQENDLRDIVLGPGTSQRIESDGLVLVQALDGAAYVLVEDGVAVRLIGRDGASETLVAPEAAKSFQVHQWARHEKARSIATVLGDAIVTSARALKRAARQFVTLKSPATAQLPR
jgi:hypothetical protein